MSIVTNNDLFELMKGVSELTVKVVNRDVVANEKSYAENGMLGVITNISIEGVYDNSTVYEYKIDWEKYSDINIPLESESFYIPGLNGGLGTMKAAGYYPVNGIETVYATDICDSGFEIVDNNTNEMKLYLMWKEHCSDITYIQWLKNIAIEVMLNGNPDPKLQIERLQRIISDDNKRRIRFAKRFPQQ
jgi:hypothetical protein